MLLFRYTIANINPIQGGTLEYYYDAGNKNLHYELHSGIKTRWFGYVKRIDEIGDQFVEPEELMSAHYKNVGTDVKFALLTGKVIQVTESTAVVAFRIDGYPITGKAYFDIRQQYAQLLHMEATGSVAGIDFDLVIQQDSAGV